MFFTLRSHPEWQKECGTNLDPRTLWSWLWKKSGKRAEKGSGRVKAVLFSMSYWERCLKVKAREKEVEESIEGYVPTPLDLLEGLPNEEEEQRREAVGGLL